MGLTPYQKKILEAIGKHGENRNIVANKLGITDADVDNALTRIYKGFKEMLFVMDEYYPVFQRRLETDQKRMKKEDMVDLYSVLRRIARKIRG